MPAEPKRKSLGSRVARILGVATVAAFTALLAYGLAARSPDRTIDDALAGGHSSPAPGFSLEVLSEGQTGRMAGVWRRAAADGTVDLEELRGTPVVLNFWASWCPPCRDEAPVLQRGWERARPQGVLFVGLDMQDARQDALAFIEKFGQDFPHVRDGTRDSARRWGTTGLPETFFINRSGRVVGHAIGSISDRTLRVGMASAVSGRPAGATSGGDQRPIR